MKRRQEREEKDERKRRMKREENSRLNRCKKRGVKEGNEEEEGEKFVDLLERTLSLVLSITLLSLSFFSSVLFTS